MTTRTRRSLAIATAPAALALVAAGLVAAVGDPPTGAPPSGGDEIRSSPDPVLDAARAKLEAAERVCRFYHDRETGAPLGGEAEGNYLWSKRRMMAEIELFRLDPKHGTKAKAIRRHLDWMRSWKKRLVESGASSSFHVATTDFYIAEAESMLAAVEGP